MARGVHGLHQIRNPIDEITASSRRDSEDGQAITLVLSSKFQAKFHLLRDHTHVAMTICP